MPSLPEYDRLDATDLAAMVRRKEVSPPELVEAAIERVEARNPPLNAVVGRCYERAREQARGQLPEGAFRGVPFLLKDMLAAPSPLFRARLAPPDIGQAYKHFTGSAGGMGAREVIFFFTNRCLHSTPVERKLPRSRFSPALPVKRL